MRKCFVCDSSNVATERRPDGDTKCLDCNHKCSTGLWDIRWKCKEEKVKEILAGISSLERGPTREMLQEEITKLQAVIVAQQDHIDVLVSANEAVHQDEIGSQLDYYDEKHENEKLELEIEDLKRQLANRNKE